MANEAQTVPARRHAALLAFVAIALAVGVAYHGSFQGPFVFDDFPAIVENPDIRSLATALRENPQLDTATAVGRPLLRVSLWANHAIGGLDVRGYHALNLALHCATAMVLFALVRLLLRSPALRVRTGAVADALALIVALVWSVHPLQTESVTYVVQRAEILGAFFCLVTLYGVARCASAPGAGASLWAVVAVLACLLGAAAKETVATAPLLAVALDRVFYATSWRELWRTRDRLYGALAMSWLLLAYLIFASGGRKETVGFDLGISWWQYALTQPYYICRYLFLTAWPGPLTLDYGRYHATTLAEVLPYAVVVLTLVALTIWALRRNPVLGFCGLWFFVLLAPTSSVVPIVSQTGAEHRMYLPLAGIVALVVVGGYVWIERFASSARAARFARIAAMLLAGVVVLALGVRTITRTTDYRSGVSIWQSAIAHWPHNPRAYVSLGAVLVHQGNPAEAIPHFESALAMQPDYVAAQLELGTALAKVGRTDEAIAQLEAVLRRHPDHPDAHNNLGNALVEAGRTREAIGHFEQAVRHGTRAQAQYNLGKALADTGQVQAAIAHYEAALALGPDDVATHVALADAFAQRNQPADAIAHYQQALRLAPDQPQLMNNLAWIYATDAGQRNPGEAIRLAERAVSIDGEQDPSLLDTLATAYASAGRFDDAVASGQRAIERARSQNQIALATQIEQRLAGHRAGRGDALIVALSNDAVRDSIERGIAWQLEQSMQRTDSILFGLWIAERVASQLPRPAARLRARSLQRYQERWPDELFLRKLIGGKQDLPDDKTVVDRHREKILARLADGTIGRSGGGSQDFLFVSLYANDPYVRGNFDAVFDALFERPLPRYGVTHQLLALYFLQREKAFPAEKIQATIDRYAAAVAESLDHDRLIGVYTDLMAERMAVLVLVGRADLLKPSWLAFAIENQRRNGQWEVEPLSVSPAGLDRDMDQHITVLSLYALAGYLSNAVSPP